jgi:TonB family protein
MNEMNYKLKIMKTRPEVTEEEIRSYMDFDQLIRQREKLIVKQNKFKFLNTILIASLTLIIASLLVYYHNTNESATKPEPSAESPAGEPSASKAFIQPEEQKEEISNPELASPDSNSDSGSPKETAITATKEDLIKPAPDALPEKTPEVEYDFVEAQPVNGYPDLYNYFNRELRYPDEGLRDSIQGVVTVSLQISESGSPQNIEIKNSLGEAFDREVIRVIENMPEWNPASVNGKPVSSRLAIPLTFQIQKLQNTENK